MSREFYGHIHGWRTPEEIAKIKADFARSRHWALVGLPVALATQNEHKRRTEEDTPIGVLTSKERYVPLKGK